MKNYQFYHIYPLGMLHGKKLTYLNRFIPYLKTMNINAVYLGPVFSSISHGYDTIDYHMVDERLGNNEDLTAYIKACHDNDIDVILDCVFNHVSRDFFAFKDILKNKAHSQYSQWFKIDFSRNNHRNDGFTYETWDGHDELVKFDLSNADVSKYLIETAGSWLKEYSIDGLRLDAADVMDRNFIRCLTENMKAVKKDFFVMGEMVHGNYMQLMQETGIDSVTNYEGYKGLYSCLNEENYFEIAYSLKRLFGKEGLVNGKLLYNFADNHDVNRVASTVKEEGLLYPLYLMLYTIKGFTSLYYKSELMEVGKRTSTSDKELRRQFLLEDVSADNALLRAIQSLSKIRHDYPALCYGEYVEVFVSHQLIAYMRKYEGEKLLVIINSQSEPHRINKKELEAIYRIVGNCSYDLLSGLSVELEDLIVYPRWGRIII